MCNTYEQLVSYAQYRDAIRAAGLTTPSVEKEPTCRAPATYGSVTWARCCAPRAMAQS